MEGCNSLHKKMMFLLNHKNFILILLITIFALVKSDIYYKHFQAREVYLVSDNAVYATLSQKFFTGNFLNGFNPYWNPGYPLATIPFFLITNSWESAQILLSMVASILLIFAVYFSLRKFSETFAILATFLMAFSPTLTVLTLRLGITEPLYILFYFLAITLGYKSLVSKELKDYIFSGFFFGIAYFIRTEVIYTFCLYLIFVFFSSLLSYKKKISFGAFSSVMVLISLVIVILDPLIQLIVMLNSTKLFPITLHKTVFIISGSFLFIAFLGLFFNRNALNLVASFRHIFLRVSVILLIFLLVNLPYITAISVHLHKPTLSGKYAFIGSGHAFSLLEGRQSTWAQDVWSIDYPQYDSPFYSGIYLGPYIKSIDSSLVLIWDRLLHYLDLYGHDNTFSQSEVYLFWFGFIISLLNKKVRQFALYIFSVWLFSLLSISWFMESTIRYLAFSFPLFLVNIAAGIWTLGSAILFVINKNARLKGFSYLFLPAWLGLLMLFYLSHFTKLEDMYQAIHGKQNEDQYLLGSWLKDRKIKVFMARTEGISFYSGAKMVYLPATTPEKIVNYAKDWGVEYIIARPHETSWDYMKKISEPTYKHPELTLIEQFPDGTLIWKVYLTEQEKKYNLRAS